MEALTLTNMDKNTQYFYCHSQRHKLETSKTLKLCASVKMEYTLQIKPQRRDVLWIAKRYSSESLSSAKSALKMHQKCLAAFSLCMESSLTQFSVNPKSTFCHNPDYKSKQKCKHNVCTKQSPSFTQDFQRCQSHSTIQKQQQQKPKHPHHQHTNTTVFDFTYCI